MKATRLIQIGEADPTNMVLAYERELAARALEAAPKTLHKLIEDGYVAEVMGRRGSRGKVDLHLYPADPRSQMLLSYHPGSKRISYRYSLQNGSGEIWYFKSAVSATRYFRRFVDESGG